MESMNASLVTLTGEVSRIKLEINNIQDLKNSLEFTEGKLEDVNTDFLQLKGKFATHLNCKTIK